VTLALQELIGTICHVYLDDIIIWSSSLAEHEITIGKVLSALRKAHLYCSMKKLTLFTMEMDFLSHHILMNGIEVDSAKVTQVLNWPVPTLAKHVQQFLRLVRYIGHFLPLLAEHMVVLTLLTKKECNRAFPTWMNIHQYMFEVIKCLVVSRDCLTTIDHKTLGDNKIFVTCNASKRWTRAMLTFGQTWETACLVVFESQQLNNAERNYPVHKQEMLLIMRAMKKWRVDLLGSHVNIFTDHKTLQNFDYQSQGQPHNFSFLKYS
jgi:RNase H-like domain found in reverse transcriptase